MMIKALKFLFIHERKPKRLPLSEQEVADYQKSKDDLVMANEKLQKVIEENHFTLNIKKALSEK
jgi:hypothetical protein